MRSQNMRAEDLVGLTIDNDLTTRCRPAQFSDLSFRREILKTDVEIKSPLACFRFRQSHRCQRRDAEHDLRDGSIVGVSLGAWIISPHAALRVTKADP